MSRSSSGFDALVVSNKKALADADVVVVESLQIRVRDGIRLAADLYIPAVNGVATNEPLPVILERTPYDKTGVSRSERTLDDAAAIKRPEVARFFASKGYAVVMQDCRGRFASEGEFTKYVNEAEDGFDTVAWISEQPWCNGSIGTMGLSYGAHTQLALASLGPPALKCMFIDSGGFSNAFRSGIRQGGAFEMKQATWAFRHAQLSPQTAADPRRKAALQSVDIAAWMQDLSWLPGHSPLAAAPEFEAYFFEQWRKGLFDEYWQRPGLYAEGFYDEVPDIPIAIVGSWYDPYASACTTNFRELSTRKQSPVRLLMGPWTHGDRSVCFAGDVDFGNAAALDNNIADDFFEFRRRWFDQYLRSNSDVESAFSSPVQYFCMGGGTGKKNDDGRMQHGGNWLAAATWPPANSDEVTLYLRPDGGLAAQPSTQVDGDVHYLFDPRDPVPTIGGAVTSGDPVMFGGAFDQVQTTDVFAIREVKKSRPLAARADVMVFETDPLPDEVVIAGPLSARLWVSSNQIDTDFTIKLVDVYPGCPDYPQGYAMNITDGIFRMRYHGGWGKEEFMSAGEMYEIEVTALDTCNRFARGHRIRVDVSSSNYPHFDINPNTGRPPSDFTSSLVARNQVYCNSKYPSHIVLNILRSTSKEDL